ncbi:hypothetical protein GCM10010304_76950 [Streptomyces roseoviolaceus]
MSTPNRRGVLNKQLPAWLADRADVSEVSQRILARLQESTLTPVGPITMKVKGFRPFDANFTMDLTPAADATFNTLRTIRRELSALLEIRPSNFETCQFHTAGRLSCCGGQRGSLAEQRACATSTSARMR